MVRKTDAAAGPTLQLPVLIFGVVEIRRLKRELESLEDFLAQAAIREPGKQPPLPRVSRLLEALAAENKLQLLQEDHRKQLKSFLAYAETKAPNLHISFAADPSSAFTAKIVTWLRANIHPHTLLEVGLQPNIAAGCIIRTNNKVFDFSLRERFKDASNLLASALQSVAGSTAPAMASAAAVTMPAPSAAPIAAVPAPVAVAAPELQAVPMAPAAGTPVPAAAPMPQAVPMPVVNVEDVAAQLAMPAATGAASVAQDAQTEVQA